MSFCPHLVSFTTCGLSSDTVLMNVLFFQVRVMIMSLKAGNLGLNMVAACHVILLDLLWNPYAEDQAIDRAHRIGQTRLVTVSRLTIKDTVEDRILALQVIICLTLAVN